METGPRQQSEGERYLELLGLSHWANEPIPDTTKVAGEFLDICGDSAREVLMGLEGLGADHPAYGQLRAVLRTQVAAYLGKSLED